MALPLPIEPDLDVGSSLRSKLLTSDTTKPLDWLLPVRVLGSGADVVAIESKAILNGTTLPVLVRVALVTEEVYLNEEKVEVKRPTVTDESLITAFLSAKGWPNLLTVFGSLRCVSNEVLTRQVSEQRREDPVYKQLDLPRFCDAKSVTVTTLSGFGNAKYKDVIIYDPVPVDLTVVELLPLTYNQLKAQTTDPALWAKIRWSAFSQCCATLQLAQDEFGFEHNDLYDSNMMFKPTDAKVYEYKIRNRVYTVPLYGWFVVLIDFGLARMTKAPGRTRTLVAEHLALKLDSDVRKEYWLPLDPYKAPLNTYYDVGCLYDEMFGKEVTALNVFMGLHGLHIDANVGRPMAVLLLFEPVDVLNFIARPTEYMTNLVASKAYQAAVTATVPITVLT
ncbi:Hypothetical protein POVN_LOCUS163 [uncultured virus]|nr:Hypothetical protein POVN_LOCUS163 [uncultured virus]